MPCAYVLLQKKTLKIYREMLEQINKLELHINCQLNPKIDLTNFESAAMKAFNHQFPKSQAKGCYLHFKQSIYRWISQHGNYINLCNDRY